jgi:phosphate transport system substrate-binding protein
MKTTYFYIQLIFGLLFLNLLSGCKETTKDGKPLDTPTSGEITIGVDESFQPLMMAEIDGFQISYKHAKVNAIYKPEGEVMQDLLKDSIRLAVISRDLTPEEREVFKQQTLTPRVSKFAIDAVCLIVNNKNLDSAYTVSQIKEMMLGNTAKWSDLNPKNIKDSIRIVFDNNNSSNLLYMQKKLQLPENLGKHIFALKSNTEVIEYVTKHPNSMGVIGISWITDSSANEKEIRRFMKENKVLAIVPDTTAQKVKNIHTDLDLNQYIPAQANIARKLYPFSRYVYVVSREARAGLGTGFAAYAAGDKGQLIVLKAGLLPLYMPLRLVHLKKLQIE